MPVLPQSSQREPQGSQRFGLEESLLAFTTFPLRPLRRHGVLCGKKQAFRLIGRFFTTVQKQKSTTSSPPPRPRQGLKQAARKTKRTGNARRGGDFRSPRKPAVSRSVWTRTGAESPFAAPKNQTYIFKPFSDFQKRIPRYTNSDTPRSKARSSSASSLVTSCMRVSLKFGTPLK